MPRVSLVYETRGRPQVPIGHIVMDVESVRVWFSSRRWLHASVTGVRVPGGDIVRPITNEIDVGVEQPPWLEEILTDAISRLPEAKRFPTIESRYP